MAFALDDPLFSLALLAPPYTAAVPAPRNLASLRPDRCAPGTLLLLQVADPLPCCTRLPNVVPSLRARFPTLPVVVWAEQPSAELRHLGCRAALLGVRAVLSADEDVPSVLRRILTRPMHLPDDVVEWLRLRGLPLDSRCAAIVRGMVNAAANTDDLDAALWSVGETPDSARKYLNNVKRKKRKHLPPAQDTFRLARALYVVLRVQDHPTTSLLRIAHDLGYSDHSSVSRQLDGVFGLRPSEVRHALGWEWLLERWVKKKIPLLA